MSIIEEFYLGNLHPYETKFNPNSKQNAAANRCEEMYLALKEFLPENKQDLLKEMYYTCMDAVFENGKSKFQSGFVTGMRFAVECFCENNE